MKLAIASLIALASYTSAAPAASSLSQATTPSSTNSAVLPTQTVAYASDDPNYSYWSKFQNSVPVPERGTTGSSILGPQNIPLDREGPDFLAPPSTDSGSIENVKWPLGLSHNRLQDGGWARQQNVHDMPIATTMAGVNMRLKAGAIREMHWHTTAEWAYVLAVSLVTTKNWPPLNSERNINRGAVV
ncbi:Oxalate decarboxylase [Ceratobasidium theobromae]|uniref:Oxalate decarboxylase n=1 Tax=Ceratobasidium theobromae TaxID=1582974 RepID=A0A5N5QFY6_9AGAM|nr:Oxalate decarboxylase [Ceratobasidium theobromae]